MSDHAELTIVASDVRDQFRRDIEAFEALERRLLAEERRERARDLSARFVGLKLTLAD
ncbi:hypothetical protein [Rhodopseudomonas pseudopalustris]|uniref:Uncharacterized protein n=1 Tax=Rhodopseudomonas pseudopalustris TaxID=1513892 RepID=A0A1H8W946_9BRAD|nr:hypothetical protein [Rhodopseudomonas pseudopalustris]MBB1091538.1 hypothetical protein [Rhodopseudomonas palustris]SEP23907.1 hypothetical protein SAMN05444123_11193 [Rhodopseudomonas pseudopalustris]